MSVTFRYGRRKGWLRCELTVNGASVVHSVNGTHDGLAELLIVASRMFERTHEATACFQEEPGEFRWHVSRLEVNRLRIRIFEFDDWGTGRPDGDGKLLFDAPCGVMSFGRAIYDGCGEWLAELNRNAAEGATTSNFPRVEYDGLREALNRFDRIH
jgi:hypothetical protein